MADPSSKPTLFLTLALAIGLIAGCDNPAADKPVAEVGEAVPTVGGDAAIADALPTPSADAPPERSPIDGDRVTFNDDTSKIGFVGSKLAGGGHDGGFNAFEGAFVIDPAAKQLKAVEVEIDMKSTWSDNEKLTSHLLNKDFFEVETYPDARFVSTEIKPAADTSKGATHDVTGNLTLHGVTKSITFPATIAVADGKVNLDSEFVLKRGDFNIVYGNAGDNVIRDEVVLKLAIEGRKPVAATPSS